MAETPQTAAKPPLILDRVKALEELTNGLAGFVENEVVPLKEAVKNLVKVINGIVAASPEGFELKVQDAIKADEAKRAEEQLNREKAMIEKLVQAGVLTAVDAVSEDSIVVGREFDSSGNLLGVGRAQVRFDQFTADAKAKVLGQGAGFVIEVPNGKFEVLEIYKPGSPKPPAVANPEPVELKGAQDPKTPEAPTAQ